jgi:ABC-type taurine transport system ATPase subunit
MPIPVATKRLYLISSGLLIPSTAIEALVSQRCEAAEANRLSDIGSGEFISFIGPSGCGKTGCSSSSAA